MENSSDKNIILKVENLKTYFHTKESIIKAVDDISFELNKGETIAIVGESGSGKSVTALSIMQLVESPPGSYDGGKIIFKKNDTEVDLLSLNDKEMRPYRGGEIAMIFQEPLSSLNPAFRCGNQVVEAIRLHTEMDKSQAKKHTLSLFEQVDLPDVERIFQSYPHQLSGGQLQRVMIAMAVSCNPQVLIADEPTTALDVTVQKKILALLNEVKHKFDTSIIFISHDLGLVKQIADKIVVMYKGKIVEQGDAKTIFENPVHPYTKGLIACRPPMDKRVRKLPTVEAFLNDKNTDFHTEMDSWIITDKQYTDRLESLEKSETILNVEHLSKWYSKSNSLFLRKKEYTKAVDDVSFIVRKGETLGLVGESGCGKSTLVRTLLNLDKPTSGNVIFQGKSLYDLSASEMRKIRKDIQIIFQDPYAALNPKIRIGRAILEPMQVHGVLNNDKERKARVYELLERVGMPQDSYDRYPHQFSGGQRQRICIARALSINPKFLICDESVSALDVSVQAQILNLLVDLRDEFELSYIFISHDLSVVKFISDRILVMKEGKIVESSDAESIINNPQENYTKLLIDAIPM